MSSLLHLQLTAQSGDPTSHWSQFAGEAEMLKDVAQYNLSKMEPLTNTEEREIDQPGKQHTKMLYN